MNLFTRSGQVYLNLRELVRMAKLSKQKLKAVVKECLVELLQEGLTSQAPVHTSLASRREQLAKHNSSKRSPALDNISFGNKPEAKNTNFEKNISEAVSGLTDDPIMASIFSETAKTTLQEQIKAEGRSAPASGQGDVAARTMAASDPSNVFGEASEKWASLAFSD